MTTPHDDDAQLAALNAKLNGEAPGEPVFAIAFYADASVGLFGPYCCRGHAQQWILQVVENDIAEGIPDDERPIYRLTSAFAPGPTYYRNTDAEKVHLLYDSELEEV